MRISCKYSLQDSDGEPHQPGSWKTECMVLSLGDSVPLLSPTFHESAVLKYGPGPAAWESVRNANSQAPYHWVRNSGGGPSSLYLRTPSPSPLSPCPGNSGALHAQVENHCHKWLFQDRPPGLILWTRVLKRVQWGSNNLKEYLVRIHEGLVSAKAELVDTSVRKHGRCGPKRA